MSRFERAMDKQRDAMNRNARGVLDDTQYDRFRTPRALGLLVAADVAVTIAIFVLWWWVGSIAGVAAVIAWIGVYLLLRMAVRSQADLPDEVLDERMRRERDQVYVVAYRAVSGVVFLGANALFISVAFTDPGTTVSFDYERVSAIYWTYFAVMTAAPSVALALRQRSV
jgi:hypothetical protein